MKKIISILLLGVILAGCDLPGTGGGGESSPASNPTMTDNEMSTRVAQILTTMPTATQEIKPKASPTTKPTETVMMPSATAVPTNTPLPAFTATFTNTPSPIPSLTLAPTLTQQPPTLTPTLGSTVDPGDPRNRLGQPSWTDPINDGRNWPIDDDQFSTGKIDNGTLMVIGKQKLVAYRLALVQSVMNGYFEISVKNDGCIGDDSYGLMFRTPMGIESNQGYLFGITCDSRYYLKIWDSKAKPKPRLDSIFYNTKTEFIKPGINDYNRLGVMTVGDRIILYINGKPVREVNDKSFTTGYFGVFIKPSRTLPMTIRVDQADLWLNLPPLQQ